MGFKEMFIGDGERYNYGSMCVPNNPFRRGPSKQKLNFYAKGGCTSVNIIAFRCGSDAYIFVAHLI